MVERGICLDNYTTEIQMDFQKDLISMMEAKLKSMGYSVSSGLDNRNIKIKYFNVLLRMVSIAPRRVIESKEFNCPRESDLAYKYFVAKSEKGENLNPYLSRNLSDLNYNDPMLNDWGIHHFHLGASLETDGFMARTDTLLFAKVTEDKIYAINIDRHGAWTQQALVEVIHNNWPELLEPYKLKGIIDISDVATDEEIGQLRKSGSNSILKLPGGSFYAPIGGGYMISGESMEAVNLANHYSTIAKRLEKYITDNKASIICKMGKNGINIGSKLAFHLIDIEGDIAEISEIGSGYILRIRLNPAGQNPL